MGERTGSRATAAWCLVGGLASFLLLGCATVPPQQRLDAYSPQMPVAQASADGEFVSIPPDYTLQPGDQLVVRFHYHPTYDQEPTVRPDGKISLRGLGVLPAAGQRPEDLAQLIAQRYSDILRDPEVDIQVKQSPSRRIYVGGEVGKPGFVNLSVGMTTLQAVVEAGGFKETAKLSNIVIVRGGLKLDETTPNGKSAKKPEALLVNLEEVLEGHNLAKDVALQPYDLVYVPKSAIAKANQFVDQYLVRMLPIRPGVGIGF
jgi:polysaccharide export outer membrane protein